jgi:hypothetical protein
VNGDEYDVSFTDGVSAALGSTRVLRLALNVLYDGMDELYDQTSDAAAKDRFHDLMQEVHQHLTRAELDALSRCGLAEFFTIVKPLAPLTMPTPQALKEITTAVSTLERHGLLALQSDALIRDRDARCIDGKGEAERDQ